MACLEDISRTLTVLLRQGGVEAYRLEASLLMEHFLGCGRYEAVVHPERVADEEAVAKMLSAAQERVNGRPLQYILGEWEFYGRTFRVGEGVLIPRGDTETLIDVVLPYAKGRAGLQILDLCSGTGCIAVTLQQELDGTSVCAVELSDAAMPYLLENVRRYGSGVRMVQGDVLSPGLPKQIGGHFDVIVSNPPYLTRKDMELLQREVAFEPQRALDGGDDGLLFYRALTGLWIPLLSPGGMLAVEVGAGQHDDVMMLMRGCGLENIAVYRDCGGICRVVSGIRPLDDR